MVADDRQWIMIEDKLEEMEYETSSSIKVLSGNKEGGGAGTILSVSEGDPVATVASWLLDTMLSDIAGRKQETYLVVNTDAVQKVEEIGEYVVRQTGAGIKLVWPSQLPFDIIHQVR